MQTVDYLWVVVALEFVLVLGVLLYFYKRYTYNKRQMVNDYYTFQNDFNNKQVSLLQGVYGHFFEDLSSNLHLLADTNIDDIQKKETLDKLSQRVEDKHQDLKKLLVKEYVTYPSVVGLNTLLKQYIDTVNRFGTKQVLYVKKGKIKPLQPEMQIHILELCKELMGNIVLYSQADFIELQIEQLPQSLHITIIDNGSKYDFEGYLKRKKKVSLQGLDSDLKPIKGTLSHNYKNNYNYTFLRIEQTSFT
ncbi:sensor histidine kinase [Myroides sp. LJL116]